MDLDRDNPLTVEIRQEMAAAYFGACRKMVDSLEALKSFDRSANLTVVDSGQSARRLELVEEAGERVYFVMIQREAMGLRCFEEFFEDYEIPDELRTRLGPKRNK